MYRGKYPCDCLMPTPCFCSELDDLHSGAIRKGALPDSRPEGDAHPQDGDLVSLDVHCVYQGTWLASLASLTSCTYAVSAGLQLSMPIFSSPVQVFFHLTVRREDERVLETTRLSEDGMEGSGAPKAFMLGKGQRMPRGWELALYGEPLLTAAFGMHGPDLSACCTLCTACTALVQKALWHDVIL